MPAIPPPPPETSFGPAVPPRRIPTSVKHQVNSTGIETASSGQRGPRGPEESYFELNGPMAYASSGNVLYDPTGCFIYMCICQHYNFSGVLTSVT